MKNEEDDLSGDETILTSRAGIVSVELDPGTLGLLRLLWPMWSHLWSHASLRHRPVRSHDHPLPWMTLRHPRGSEARSSHHSGMIGTPGHLHALLLLHPHEPGPAGRRARPVHGSARNHTLRGASHHLGVIVALLLLLHVLVHHLQPV